MEPLSAVEKLLQIRAGLSSEAVSGMALAALICLLGTVHALLHEIAHAVAYTCCGRPPQVTGIGVAAVKIRGTFFVFPLPLAGFTGWLCDSDGAGLGRAGRMLARISGPAATAGATATSVFLARSSPPDNPWNFIFTLFAALGAFALPGNFILPGSDGAKFWRDLTDRQESLPGPRTLPRKILCGLLTIGRLIGSLAAGTLLAAAAVAACRR